MESMDTSYGAFSSALHARVGNQRLPMDVTIEVTRRCPFNCAHCYNNLPMGDREASRHELTVAEHHRILDQLADAGCLWLCFTGGEIFARRDFLDIYTYAKRKGFLVTLFTNGAIVTPRIADTLGEWRPFDIEVTLYGRTRETFERLTRTPGSYDRCLDGIRILKERGLPLSLKTVVVTLNRHEIHEMKRFAEEELGLSFKFDAEMTPRIDCSMSPLEVRLTPEEVVELDLEDPDRLAEWERFANLFIGPQHPPGKEDEVYTCGGGINSFAIDPMGKMSVCVLSHRETYDLRTGTVEEGWNRFLRQVRDQRTSRVTKCTRCHLMSMCGKCPANGDLETGDPESPVDFLCHAAHLRARLFDWHVAPHGRCEYCEGGAGHAALLEEAIRLRRKTGASPSPAEVSSSGECGGCRAE